MLSEKDICFTSLINQIELIKNKKISCLELNKIYLNNIKKLNPIYNCFISVDDEEVLKAAKRKDEDLSKNKIDKKHLYGIPISVKDVIKTKDLKTTYGSIIYKDHVETHDSVSVERIKKNQGIIIGKTNTPEFAFGAICENKILGSTKNPWNQEYSSGGSSGGSAAAVSLGLSPVSLGTDFGGSVRTPAAFCGCVGLRPTPGRIPNSEKYNAWKWLSTEGILARNIDDAFYFLKSISGAHKHDPFSLYCDWLEPKQEFNIASTLDFGQAYNVDPEIKNLWEKTIADLCEILGEIKNIHPNVENADQSFKTLRSFNSWMNYQDLVEKHTNLLTESFVWNVKQGEKISTQQLKTAEMQQHEIYKNFMNFFENIDILIVPSTSVLPFKNTQNNVEVINGIKTNTIIDYLACTYFISLVGFPSVSLPSKFKQNEFPFGIQLISKPFNELTLLKIAKILEKKGYGYIQPQI